MPSRLNPYINFDGNTREAMEFYRDVFGGELKTPLSWRSVRLRPITFRAQCHDTATGGFPGRPGILGQR